jgi:hypothetical protein
MKEPSKNNIISYYNVEALGNKVHLAQKMSLHDLKKKKKTEKKQMSPFKTSI